VIIATTLDPGDQLPLGQRAHRLLRPVSQGFGLNYFCVELLVFCVEPPVFCVLSQLSAFHAVRASCFPLLACNKKYRTIALQVAYAEARSMFRAILDQVHRTLAVTMERD
jgi:hypothetical protein